MHSQTKNKKMFGGFNLCNFDERIITGVPKLKKMGITLCVINEHMDLLLAAALLKRFAHWTASTASAVRPQQADRCHRRLVFAHVKTYLISKGRAG